MRDNPGVTGRGAALPSRACLLLAVLIVAGSCTLRAQNKTGPAGVFRPQKTAVTWAKHAHQGFSMRLWLSNQMEMGRQAWNDGGIVPPEPCSDQGIGLEYPAGSCIEHLFGAGPWIAGIVDGTRTVSEPVRGDASSIS